MSSDEGTQDIKSRAEDRKMNREKHKAIQNGTYVPSVLERAKDILRDMQEPSLEKLIEQEELKN